MTPQVDARAADAMLQICLRTGPDGERLYSDAEVAAFVPFLLVAFAPAVDPAQLAPPARALLGDLATRLGVDGTDPSATAAALRGHFQSTPPNAALVKDFERFFREVLKDRAPGAAAAAFSSFVGSVAKGALTTAGEARPAGTVPASPFARFQVQKTKTVKKGS